MKVPLLSSLIGALLIAPLSGPLRAETGQDNPAKSPREVINFNAGWKFLREDAAGAEKPEFADNAWQDVGLPHCYNDQDTFDKFYGLESYKAQNPVSDGGDGGWQGKTWYRKHFRLDRSTRLPKDMYGALRVLFAGDTPETYLMGHWNYEEKKSHTVDVYSTCDEVELFINDKSFGKKPTEDRWVSWENVPFTPGRLKAVGYNSGSPDAFDERVTAGTPAKIKLECLTNPKGMRADRSDVAIITATIVDKDGNWHPLADPKLTFQVDGPGNYRGGFNDYLEHTTGKPSLLAEAGKIRVSVRSTDQPGKVTVTASAEGLEPGSVSYDVLP